jgi:hypothetical protein
MSNPMAMAGRIGGREPAASSPRGPRIATKETR